MIPEHKLNTCPFCGEMPEVWDIVDGRVYIDCQNKECIIQPGTPEPRKLSEASLIWNRRS